jgi:hypothetical protein
MMYEIAINQFSKMLNNLSQILDKAAEHAVSKKFDVEILLNARLAPDQFNLIRQVQIACDTAKLGAARLAGKEAPAHDDNEKTLPELKARIEKVVAYLSTFTPQDFTSAETRKISQPRWEDKYLSGTEFLIQHAFPNVCFHIATTYSILRHNGVDVGKKNFLGEMPFKR